MTGISELNAIRCRWQSLNISIRNGLSEDSIADFERRYLIRMPDGIRQFYQFMDGMEYGEADEELISFWPLSEVAPVPEKLSDFRGIPDYGGIETLLPEASSYFVFADHSIWVHVYAVKMSNRSDSGEVVWIGGGNQWSEIARSFEDFIKRYVNEPRSVLFP